MPQKLPDRLSRFRGALLGVAIGDAIGEIAQTDMDRWREPLVELVKARKRLEWTDDTAMTLGLAEILADDGAIDGERLAARFHARWSAEPWRGYAGGPPTIFALVEKDGISYAEAARRVASAQFGGQGSFGNGAAMRAAPVGLFFSGLPAEALYDRAIESAAPTHIHHLGIEGAALIAMAVSLALSLDSESPFEAAAFAAKLRAACRFGEYREALDTVAELLDSGSDDAEAARRLGTGIEAHKSAPFALWSFLRHPLSFEDCLACAAGNGGDTDTLAAMACGISGAYLGEPALPRTWLDKLEEGGYIAALADRLYARAMGDPAPAGASKVLPTPDRSAFAQTPADTASGIMNSEYYRKHVGFLRKIEVASLEGAAALEEAEELLEEDPIPAFREERREEMRRSGTWYHSNGEPVSLPRNIALGRHEWYVPFAEELARHLGSEVYLLDFLIWPDMTDPQGSLLWFIMAADRIDINLRGITAHDLELATSGAGGAKGSRRELGLPYMTSWEINRVYWDDYLERTWWHTGGSMTAAQARETLGERVPAARILEDDPAGMRERRTT
jgi:poly(ADP-ribose) glycohydrolase ARH3